jgi:GNAT superfamily N-acetyltransferase
MKFECRGQTFCRLDFDSLFSDSPELFKWSYDLIRDNMEFRHSKSKFLPWCKKTKLQELQDPLTRFIIIFDSIQNPIAFASYQITTEPDVQDVPIPCLYWFELQVVKHHRNFGLGSYLVTAIEEIALNNISKCQKIILTAFKPLPRNKLYRSPIDFYTRHGFKSDPISPSQCLKSKEATVYDYEIMSKDVLNNFQIE